MIKSVKKLLSLLSILFLAQATLYAPNKGLVNQNGDDCFFSSSFQCLSQIEPLIAFLRDNAEFRTPGSIQARFYKFVLDMKTKSRLTEAFREFITGDVTDNFFLHEMATGQRDAHEFLTEFLRCLIEKTPYHVKIAQQLEAIIPAARNRQNMIKKIMEILNADMQKIVSLKEYLRHVIRIQPENAILLGSLPLAGHDPEWKICDVQISKLKELYSIFNIGIQSTLTCPRPTCKYSSEKLVIEQALSLYISEKKPVSLKNCLEAYEEPQILSNKDKWLCDGCNQRVRATKQDTLVSLPKVLILSLKRFIGIIEDKKFVAKKINTPVSFTLELPITIKAEDIKDAKILNFNLFGIVCHNGTAGKNGGGHYWAYVNDRMGDDQWRKYDDARVSPEPLDAETDILNLGNEPEPYVFFYELDTGDERTRAALVAGQKTPEPTPDIKPPVVSLGNIETDVTDPLASLQAIATFCKSLEEPINNFNNILKKLEKFQLQAFEIFQYDDTKYKTAPKDFFNSFFTQLTVNNFTLEKTELAKLTFKTTEEIDLQTVFLRNIYDSTMKELSKIPQNPILKSKIGFDDTSNALLCYWLSSEVIKLYTKLLILLPVDLKTSLAEFMKKKDALLLPATQTNPLTEIRDRASALDVASKKLVDLTQCVATISSLLKELEASVTTFNIKNIVTLIGTIKKSSPAKPEELLQKSLQDLNTQFLTLKDALSKINSKPVPTIKSKTPSKK